MRDWNAIVELGSETLWLALKISAPVILVVLAVGLLISLLQALTQVHEQALTVVPKLAATYLVIVLGAAWAFAHLRELAIRILDSLGRAG